MTLGTVGAFGDYDDDGDEDIYAVLGGAYSGDVYPNALLRNPGNDNAWITLSLIGQREGERPSNLQAVGARVLVELTGSDGNPRAIHRVVSTGGSFGASSHQLEIGLGRDPSLDSIAIRWPSGRTTRHTGLPLRHHITIYEDGTEAVERKPRTQIQVARPAQAHDH